MSAEVTKDILEDIKSLLRNKDQAGLIDALSKLHAADIADVFDHLRTEDAIALYNLLDEEQAPDVLVELDDDLRETIFESLSSKEIAEHVDSMESDDAADIISELPESKQEEVIANLEDTEQASDIVDLLSYDEGTAGALMAKELIALRKDMTVAECVTSIRELSDEVDDIYAVYVTDELQHLAGIVDLKKILLNKPEIFVVDIYDKEVISVNTDTKSEEVAWTMDQYDLVVLPVVDDKNRLVGRITIDDVVDVIKEEAERDYQMASGISEDVESHDSIWLQTRARLPWLLVGMIGGLLNAQLLGLYSMSKHIELAIFMPLIAAMGGNVGVQSSAIVVQGLAANALVQKGIVANVLKDLGSSLVNALVCSILVVLGGLILNYDINLSLTVSIALAAVMIYASVSGTLIPLVLNRLNIDPAVATGPFITTTNDILGLSIYFGIAHLMYAG